MPSVKSDSQLQPAGRDKQQWPSLIKPLAATSTAGASLRHRISARAPTIRYEFLPEIEKSDFERVWLRGTASSGLWLLAERAQRQQLRLDFRGGTAEVTTQFQVTPALDTPPRLILWVLQTRTGCVCTHTSMDNGSCSRNCPRGPTAHGAGLLTPEKSLMPIPKPPSPVSPSPGGCL